MPKPWDAIPLEKWRLLLAIAVDMHDIDPADLAEEDERFTVEDKIALEAWADEVIADVRSAAYDAEKLPKSTLRFIEDTLGRMGPGEREKAEAEFETIKAGLVGKRGDRGGA